MIARVKFTVNILILFFLIKNFLSSLVSSCFAIFAYFFQRFATSLSHFISLVISFMLIATSHAQSCHLPIEQSSAKIVQVHVIF